MNHRPASRPQRNKKQDALSSKGGRASACSWCRGRHIALHSIAKDTKRRYKCVSLGQMLGVWEDSSLFFDDEIDIVAYDIRLEQMDISVFCI